MLSQMECKTSRKAPSKEGLFLHIAWTAQTSKLKDMRNEERKGFEPDTKEVLTSNEAAEYMGISKSYLYKLTMNNNIPHYKPMGKMCYFNREELVDWLQSNRVATTTELNERANAYCMQKGGRV